MKTTTGMKGGGYYDRHSVPQSKVIQSAMPFLLDALAGAPLADGKPFVIADFGCSEGRNSINLARLLVSELRKSKQSLPVVVVHNDLPSNDFNSFFRNLYSDEAHTYMTRDSADGDPNLFALASGSSFYKQILPGESLSLALSFSALHWLSCVPSYVIPDNNISLGRGQAHEAVKRQAKSDWEKFLFARAAEFMPGGKLFCAMIGSHEFEEGKKPDKNYTGAIFELIKDVLTKLLAENKVDQRRCETFLFPAYPRTVTEITEPLSDPNSSVFGLFEIKEASLQTIPLPMKTRYEEDGDLNAYAATFIAFIRAFSETVFAGNMFDTPAELDNFYFLMEEQFKSDLNKYDSDMHFLFVYLSRV